MKIRLAWAHWSRFAAAALAHGDSPIKAAELADELVELLRERVKAEEDEMAAEFTPPPPEAT